MEYEEIQDGDRKRKLFKKKDLRMESKVKVKRPNTKSVKTTLSIFTYLNFRHFGLAVRIEDGIKFTVLWFETHIKFEKR